MPLQSQTIVIFGGTSGVGLATAQALHAAGAFVIITGREESKLQHAITQVGTNARGETLDAADAAKVREFFARLGRFDHLVLALSGGKGGGPFRELKIEDLRAGFDAKFFLHAAAMRAALPTLRHDGSITLVSAISARAANPGTAGLAAINGAIECMVPVLAMELKPLRVNAVSPGVIDTPWWDRFPEAQRKALFEQSTELAAWGITVNHVAPGWIPTERHAGDSQEMKDAYAAAVPMRHMGKPEDVAGAILFLVENTFMTGAVIECDGGLRLA